MQFLTTTRLTQGGVLQFLLSTEVHMHHINNSLLSQLTDFGLNPREWRLEIKTLKGALLQVRLLNKIEKGLVLHGFADRSAWLELSYQG